MAVNYVQLPDYNYKGNPVFAGVTLTYKLVLDTPVVTKTNVTLSGSAPGLLNVEVFDAAGKLLIRLTPDAFGHFSGVVSTTGIAAGTVSWNVYGWDSAPGVAFTNSDQATLSVAVVH